MNISQDFIKKIKPHINTANKERDMDWGILSMIVLDLEPFSFVNRFEVPLLIFLHLSYCRPGFLTFSCIANEKYNVRCPKYYTGLLDKVFIECCPFFLLIVTKKRQKSFAKQDMNQLIKFIS